MKHLLELLLFVGVLTGTSNVSAQVTYADDIADIVYTKCASCHRSGEIGPMSFSNYEEVKSWGATIKNVTQSKYMPPWLADPSYSRFQAENFLTDDELNKIAEWVDNGMPRGDAANEPAFPEFVDGSAIGTPDLLLEMAEPYMHKGNNKDDYRYFVLPSGLTEDKVIKTMEFRPGNTQIVHHALIFEDNSGESEFQPPKKAMNGHGTGLYAGEQDMFAFLIDDNAWVDIGQNKFAPGFFVWNSEVGSRSLGIQTFWYQHICGNHIVWDCMDVNEFTRKHTSSVREGLGEIKRMIESLVDVKTQRQEKFAAKIKQSQKDNLGSDIEDVTKLLRKQGIPMAMIKNAANVVGKNHTAFAWVDALTRASGCIEFAGARSTLDQKIGSLLTLAV